MFAFFQTKYAFFLPLVGCLLVVGHAGAAQPVNFDNEIIPVLTKAGCNTGACHGAAIGRGGFRLSLYGGDASADYDSIVHELQGRRVNLSRPQESLLLMKPTESMEHGGGYRLGPDQEGARRLLNWIEQGADRARGAPELVRLEVQPSSFIGDKDRHTTPLKAVAHFRDSSGLTSSKVVTDWTVFTPDDDASVRVDAETGIARVLRAGRHIVVARYLDQVVPVELILPLSSTEFAAEESTNFIDRYIAKKLSVLGLGVSDQASDAEVLRRLCLDLTGRLPSVERVQGDVVALAPENRSELINSLIDSDEFNQYWTFQFSKLLRIRSQPQDKVGMQVYHAWLSKQIASGVGYDELARQLLTSVGDTHSIGPANFYRAAGGPREQAEFTSELFMGSRLRCANCHNHPLDRWTQDDYHGLAAIFATLRVGKVVSIDPRGKVSHPRTGDDAIPKIPGLDFKDGQQQSREALADWLADEQNPFFAKAIVNRLWKSMMGRGLVEPTDDLRETNPATHPLLLDELAADFVRSGYDFRHTLRVIANSDAYSRSSKATAQNVNDDRFYSYTISKSLEPEVLADAVSDVLGLAEQYGDQPLGTRAIALVDPKVASESLDVLGRCSREESCEAGAGPDQNGGLPRKLHLFNGAFLNRRIVDADSRLQKLIHEQKTPAEIVCEFYLRTLSRKPTESEQSYWSEQLAESDADQMSECLEDFVWSLLTCRAFVTNH
ncbi:MAG: DUF1553 domain-containing protein [Rubripirellula sp.]